MKKVFKGAAICMAAVLAVSGLTACQKTETGSNERKTLKVSIFERGDVPAGAGSITDNAMTQWIQKEFGDENNVDVEFVSIPRAQEVQQLNVLMSAGEAPDIIFTYDYSLIYNYYKQGGLHDLTEYVNNSPQLKELMGEEHLKYGQIDGKQVMIPGKTMVVGTFGQLIRQDWLDKLGLPVPTTTDELYNTLKAFKEKDPGSTGGKTIPYGVSLHHILSQNTLIRSFIDYDSLSETEKVCMSDLMMPGAKEGVRFMNKLYNEGLISKDFALDKDRKQLESDFSNGNVGFIVDDLGRPLSTGGVYDTLKNTVPGAEVTPVDTFTDSKGRHPKAKGNGISLLIAVPKSCKNPDVAVKYLDWMASEEVIRTLQYGFEGVNYNLDENGVPVEIVSDEARKTHWGNTLALDLAIIVNGKYAKDIEKRTDMVVQSYGDKADIMKKCIEYSLNDAWSNGGPLPPVEAYTKYHSVVSTKEEQVYVKSITAPQEQFDEVYDSLYDEYMKSGQDKIYEETCKMYEEVHKN